MVVTSQDLMPDPSSSQFMTLTPVHDPDDCIRKLFIKKGRIALVSASDIVAVCKKFPSADANLLVRKFYP